MRTRPWSLGLLALLACESAPVVTPEPDDPAEDWQTLACVERRKPFRRQCKTDP